MSKSRDVLFIPLLALFIGAFLIQDRAFTSRPVSLQALPPYPAIKAATGYLYRVTAEIFFVQSAVFIGGLKPGVDHHAYAPTLAHNYLQTAALYPKFTDVYYYAQAHLPHIGTDLAETTNEIHEIGKNANEQNLIIHFFQGFNSFRYLENPLLASEIFQEASKLPEAPPLFSRLAIILAAEGGQLEAAIISLKALLNDPKADDATKHRYFEELVMFTDALTVQEAVKKFKTQKGTYPQALEQLVPEYIPALPTFGTAFVLTWKAPNVGLKRP